MASIQKRARRLGRNGCSAFIRRIEPSGKRQSIEQSLKSLSNAFTSAFKQLDPIPQFKATAKLGEFLEGSQLEWPSPSGGEFSIDTAPGLPASSWKRLWRYWRTRMARRREDTS